ncbi:MAG: adenylate/guanylate cyclase domain-containing protein [Winogradskyella sp.]|uniref:adenylate/guanylate cyclase domain-containing protein n=1 Tax=Winogradskyella sp. TaxID=1883156 RepID=UPI000F3E4C35|nr:adenylate/guanylate cyclase domain-containing protein [Winogradskyella sp.]RNC84223.1 MAG: adenylate/guanylate cyclase domain-containing protein [Winogradskyella sp.]
MELASHKVNLFKENITIECTSENTILEATLANHINHTHACGGQGKCSTCRVSVMEGIEHCGSRNDIEQKIASILNFPSEIRLACQTKITGDIAIRRMVSDKLDMDIISEQFSEDSNSAIGSQQKVTIVFTDIVNYTSFAERFPPYDIVHVLNRYYRIMNNVIQNHNGLISDVAGDGILAVFGIDGDDENSVLCAIKAIGEMNVKLDSFNKYLLDNFNTKFGIRAGVHYGNVIVGPFDTGAMKKTAVIGDNVNYASRIETSNKEFDTQLLLSEEAYNQVKDSYPNYNTYKTELKGKTGVYNLYELI